MEHRVSIEQLRVGVYIHLDLSWMDHPFSFGSFKIKSQDQIEKLRELGLQSVRIDPAKSDVQAAAPARVPAPLPSRAGIPVKSAPEDPAIAAKKERQRQLAAQREAIARVDRQYNKAANTLRSLHAALQANPAQSAEGIAKLADAIAGDLFAQAEITLYSLLSNAPGAEAHAHGLNVALLSLVVAREMQIPAEDGSLLAQGAFVHDIGLREVPARVLLKEDPLTAAEKALRDEHVGKGSELARRMGLPDKALEIIKYHHVMADGSGYPAGVPASALSPLARIVALVNQYDNLCNPVNSARALTPHEALSHIFSQQRQKFDEKAMQALIRCLGVYPPGTLIKLSNEAVCVVSSVNTARPLRPAVIAYDAKTPRDTPVVIDLAAEDDVNISAALKRAQVPAKVLEYLTGRGRVTYFYESVPA